MDKLFRIEVVAKIELENALLGEAIKKQESLTQIQTTDFYR